MKHSIRQRVIDPVTGLKVTKIETVTGELGSGVFDKNGKEIFENDLVKVDIDALEDDGYLPELNYHPPTAGITCAVYMCGEFLLKWDSGGGATCEQLSKFGCFKDKEKTLEVIGHVDD